MNTTSFRENIKSTPPPPPHPSGTIKSGLQSVSTCVFKVSPEKTLCANESPTKHKHSLLLHWNMKALFATR